MVKDFYSETKTTTRSVITSKQVKQYFIAKGYSICNVIPITNSRKWFAVLVKNREYIQATVFTNDQGIERIEESIL